MNTYRVAFYASLVVALAIYALWFHVPDMGFGAKESHAFFEMKHSMQTFTIFLGLGVLIVAVGSLIHFLFTQYRDLASHRFLQLLWGLSAPTGLFFAFLVQGYARGLTMEGKIDPVWGYTIATLAILGMLTMFASVYTAFFRR